MAIDVGGRNGTCHRTARIACACGRYEFADFSKSGESIESAAAVRKGNRAGEGEATEGNTGRFSSELLALTSSSNANWPFKMLHVPQLNVSLNKPTTTTTTSIQMYRYRLPTKRWALGCVNLASWPPLAAGEGAHATQGPPFSRSLYLA